MSKRQKAPEGDQDAEIILLCAKYVALWHEERVISAAAELAPDEGPLHARFEEIGARERQIIRRLYELGAPSTKGGITAMAEAAVAGWPRNADGACCCENITEWLSVAVVHSVISAGLTVEPGDCLERLVA